jgi:hypothetical protein
MVPANFVAMKIWWSSFFPDAQASMVFVYGSSIPFNVTQGAVSGVITGPLYEAYERWINKN